MEKKAFLINVNSPLDSEYIQKLSFKAGYGWHGNEQKVLYPETKQLVFRGGKYLTRNSGDRLNIAREARVDIYFSFPKDAISIFKTFNTLEYKVGDYVVLRYNEIERWGKTAEEAKFSGSTQKIGALPVINNEKAVLFEGIECSFLRNDIARHATDDEIKAYKEGGDIYIGEYKVEFSDTGNIIKVGCVTVSHGTLKSLHKIRAYTRTNDDVFTIHRSGVEFERDNICYSISSEKLNKIFKKVGI